MNKNKIICGILVAQLSLSFMSGGIVAAADEIINDNDVVESVINDAEEASEELIGEVVEDSVEEIVSESIEDIDNEQVRQLQEGTLVIDGVKYKLNHDTFVSVTGVGDDDVEDISIPNSIIVGGTRYQVTAIADFAFSGNEVLKNVDINSKDVITLNSDGSTEVESSDYENMYYIGYRAFYGCTGLENINIPSSLNGAAYDSFVGCDMSKLQFNFEDESCEEVLKEEIAIDRLLSDPEVIVYDNPEYYLTWSDDNECSGNYLTFKLNSDGETASVSSYESDFGYYYGLSYGRKIENPLSHMEVPGVIRVSGRYYRVTKVDDCVFAEASYLKELKISKGIESLGGCLIAKSGVTDITIPDTVTSLGSGLFDYASHLEDVTIPGSVKRIGPSMFVLSGIKNVILEEGVQYIDRNAFANCNRQCKLNSISIPESLIDMDDKAFKGVSITTVYASQEQYDKFESALSIKSAPTLVIR